MPKYPWHPPQRPPPADSTLSSKINLLGPIAKCLETALGELSAESAAASAEQTSSAAGSWKGNVEDRSSRATNLGANISTSENDMKLKVSTEKVYDNLEIVGENNGDTGGRSDSSVKKKVTCTVDIDPTAPLIGMDESISREILEAYGKAMTDTQFDCGNKRAAPHFSSATSHLEPANTAPAAMLHGKIDHYNRVGGQWRIVVKDAVIRTRSVIWKDNGLIGRSKRRRLALDWGSSLGTQEPHLSMVTSSGRIDHPEHKSSCVSLKGPVQILAYDDI